MNLKDERIIINIGDPKYHNWKTCLRSQLGMNKASYIEIESRNIDLSCSDVLEIIEIMNQYNCKIIGFYSTSPKTIVSTQSLGYKSQLILENFHKKTSKINENNQTYSETYFHKGTVRSGEYLDHPGDLLILGDVNPGAKVTAEGNIIIWGKLLGIAHAGSKGNSQATISALYLRPVQLRIAKKVARGPNEKPQLGIAEQARIDYEKIIIYPLDAT
tara:strand:- start:623 stop:1270 length:648 start_codon:yes stop_codon:yes gene_type:complete